MVLAAFILYKDVIKVNKQQELHDDSDDRLTVEDIEDLMGINRDVYKIVKGRVKRAEVSEMLE